MNVAILISFEPDAHAVRAVPLRLDLGRTILVKRRVSGKIFSARGRQIRQVPDGACCSGRSQNDNRSSISFASLRLRLEMNARLLLSLKELTQAAFKSGDHVFGAFCRSGVASDGTIILHLE
jgi:hypothetical protein